MKVTDYAPRAAIFDTYLTGTNLIGAEIGTDVGSHAEAMLIYADIKHLTLVDIWDKEYYRGYCEGRLRNYRNVTYIKRDCDKLDPFVVDFVYFDIPQDYDLITRMLKKWWPLADLLCVRGAGFKEVLRACQDFRKDCIVTDDDIILKK